MRGTHCNKNQGPVQGGLGLRDPVLWEGQGATFNLTLGREMVAVLERGLQEPNRILNSGLGRRKGTLG